jgi:vanillate O-demethylase monooxygenase subunit
LGLEDVCPHRKKPLCKGWRKGDMARAGPTDTFKIENYGNHAWGINRGAAMDLGCNYLLLRDSLLDPIHVASVHQSSFATVATKDTPPAVYEDG